jgi:hypothetical protein
MPEFPNEVKLLALFDPVIIRPSGIVMSSNRGKEEQSQKGSNFLSDLV